jgi:hypothetical protein
MNSPNLAAAVHYKASRLTFKREVIEPLEPNQAFEVTTPEGVFRMTKAQFYEAFPGVVASASYLTGGLYNYARTPARARAFLIGPDASAGPPAASYMVPLLNGYEPLHRDGHPLSRTILDFWRWADSDLLSNALRGRLAEYLVAVDLGVDQSVRREWVAWDLVTADGVRVEVKSAAFVQGWAQKRSSIISFGVSRTRGWDPDTAEFGADTKRQADVYVFALLHETDRDRVDPLDVNHWRFFIVGSPDLDEHLGQQKTVGLSRLKALPHTEVPFGEIADGVRRIARSRSTDTRLP